MPFSVVFLNKSQSPPLDLLRKTQGDYLINLLIKSVAKQTQKQTSGHVDLSLQDVYISTSTKSPLIQTLSLESSAISVPSSDIYHTPQETIQPTIQPAAPCRPFSDSGQDNV